MLQKLGKESPDDDPITYAQILDVAGLDDALRACKAEPQYFHLWRLYAIWCARRVLHLTGDPRSAVALDVAERYVNGRASMDDLRAVADTARLAAEEAAATDASGEWPAAPATAAVWSAVRGDPRDAADGAICAVLESAGPCHFEPALSERTAQAQAFRQLVTTGTLP